MELNIFFKIKLLIKKLLNIFNIIFNKNNVIKNPNVIMTILVKNEEDIIEENILFHMSMGIDKFIITNNNSTDKTRLILSKYKKKGYILEIIDEYEDTYNPVKWVDRMILMAREKYNADWVINSDADEFWLSKNGNLKYELSKAKNNVFKVKNYNVLPENENIFWHNTKLIKDNIDTTNIDVGKYSLYEPQISKVIHRTFGYGIIGMGNHDVKMKKKSELISRDIIIFHFNIRSEKHFKTKMSAGGASAKKIKQNKNNSLAAHWKYFYNLIENKEMNVKDIYNRMSGKNNIDSLKEKDVFFECNKVKEIMTKIIKEERIERNN